MLVRVKPRHTKKGIVALSTMAAPLRIGLFPYLNVQPLIFGLGGERDIEVVSDLPSRVADRFRAGELDLAMVPSLEAASLDAPVLGSVCIASDGPVETVILHHRAALSEVRTVAIDEASRTSAALARILIARASGRLPESRSFSPAQAARPDTDAVLVIGDPAFRLRLEGFTALDLGQEWRAQQGLPFVFAVMVRRPGLEAPGIGERIRGATLRGVEAAPIIARSYDSGVDPARAENYMRKVIRYDLGSREKEGLALFYGLARKNGLLGQVGELEFDAS